MPGKWLTWTPKSVNSANVEPSKPAKLPADQNFDGFDGGGVCASPKITIPASKGEQAFPHCPRCASFYLYRKDNQGNYECQSCGLREITEAVARRIQ